MSDHRARVSEIWNVKELLRDHYKRHQYGEVILPFTVLRRLESVLDSSRAAVFEAAKRFDDPDLAYDLLCHTSGRMFYNTSRFTFANLLDDEDNIAENWLEMLRGYNREAREMVDRFGLTNHIDKLNDAGILYLVTKQFSEQELSPEVVSNVEMGYVYEELVRLTADLSNEEAGEHFTPREVIELMVNLVFSGEDELFAEHKIARIYDPTCGTGGMLTAAQDHIRAKNPNARTHLYGQEIQPESFATARADMMIEDREAKIEFGDTLKKPTFDEGGTRTDGDAFANERFGYMFANPPYGKDWKTVEAAVKAEHKSDGFDGRFGAGLPATTDGQILFVQHMISKMLAPEDGGSRIAVVLNGSPLFSGAAGSGLSEIRRWVVENDWLDAVIGLPDQMFYNTDISTYVWIIGNKKPPERSGYVQFIDARSMFAKMRKSLGKKRKELASNHITEITRIYEMFTESDVSRIMQNEELGYIELTVERPLRQRYEASSEALASLYGVNSLKKLDVEAVCRALEVHADEIASQHDDEAARNVVRLALASVGVKGKAHETALLKGLSVRDPAVSGSVDAKGRIVPDTSLRDTELLPLPVGVRVSWSGDVTSRFSLPAYRTAIETYMTSEVQRHVPDAFVDWQSLRIGYELPFTREFFRYQPPRELAEIRDDLEESQKRILELLREVGV